MIGRMRARWAALAVIGGLAAVRLSLPAGICAHMSMLDCVLAAALLMAGGSLVAVVVRASWVGVKAARFVAALPVAEPTDRLRAAADSAGVHSLRYVHGDDVTAFCAGLFRPRVYLTTAAFEAFGHAELSAVLAHEAAHARRRDPLRRLLGSAAADVFFYVPLARWWSRRQVERAEVGADRAAIEQVGRPAVAAALLVADAASAPAVPTAFAGSTQARVAQLLGDPPPERRLGRRRVALSFAGLYTALLLMMCLGQALPAA